MKDDTSEYFSNQYISNSFKSSKVRTAILIVCIEFEGQPCVLENFGPFAKSQFENKTEKMKIQASR